MNKLAVNNYIVGMRKDVKRTRVRLINKLVRKIRKLKTKKGTDKQKEKNLRKVEKLVQEIAVAKKLNIDDVSKYALLCTEDLAKVLNNLSISLEEKVKALFASNQIMSSKVKEFRDLYPEWEVKLPVILAQLGMQYRLKKKKKALEKTNTDVGKKSKVRGQGKRSLNGRVVNSEFQSRNESKTKSSGQVLQAQCVSDNESGDEKETDRVKEKSQSLEGLDRLQRFKFVLRNPDTNSEDSDGSISDVEGGENGNNTEHKDDLMKIGHENCKEVKMKENSMVDAKKLYERKKQKPSETSTRKMFNESISEANSNVLSTRSLQNLFEKEKLNSFELNGGFVGIKNKTQSGGADIVKVKRKSTGTAEILKFSELLERTEKETQSSNILSVSVNVNESTKDSLVLSERADMRQEEKKNFEHGMKMKNAENNDISAREAKDEVRDAFFLTGDDSGCETDSELEKEGKEGHLKKQNLFARQFVSSRKGGGEENGRSFQKSLHNRQGRVSDVSHVENKTLKEFSRRSEELVTDCIETSESSALMNETQKKLLGLAFSSKSKPAVFHERKGSFPPNGPQPLNRKQRRLLERASGGRAVGESEDHLHPSWEAKRKQKMQILPFQGKKIKFDEN